MPGAARAVAVASWDDLVLEAHAVPARARAALVRIAPAVAVACAAAVTVAALAAVAVARVVAVIAAEAAAVVGTTAVAWPRDCERESAELARWTFLRCCVISLIVLWRVRGLVREPGPVCEREHPDLTRRVHAQSAEWWHRYVLACVLFVLTEGVGLAIYFTVSATMGSIYIFGVEDFAVCGTVRDVSLYTMSVVTFLPNVILGIWLQRSWWYNGSSIHFKTMFIATLCGVTIVSFRVRIWLVYDGGYAALVDSWLEAASTSLRVALAVVVPLLVDGMQCIVLIAVGRRAELEAEPEAPSSDAVEPLLTPRRPDPAAADSPELLQTTGTDIVTDIRHKCGTYIPSWAYTKESATLFNGIHVDDDHTSIADYCARPHQLARYAALIVLVAEVVAFFLAPYSSSLLKNCLGVLVGLIVALLDFCAVRYFILKWQETVFELNIPVLSLMIGPVAFNPWLFSSLSLTVMNAFGALINAGNIGAIVLYPEHDLPQRFIALSVLVVVNSNLFLTLVYTLPTQNRYRAEPAEEARKLRVEDLTQYKHIVGDYETRQRSGKGTLIKVEIVDIDRRKTVEEKGFPKKIDDERFRAFPITMSITFGERQEAAFRPFDRPREEGSDLTKEVRFSTWAHWLGLQDPNWRPTHFEALVDWSRTAGLVCCQGTSPSFFRVGAMRDMSLLDQPRVDGKAPPERRAANKARNIADSQKWFMFKIGLLKHLPQIAVQVHRFCRKCEAVERGSLAEYPGQEDIAKLLFLFAIAALTVSDIYLSTSKVYNAVYTPLKEHAKRQSSSAQWDFGTYEGFFNLHTAYSQMQMFFGIFAISIVMLLGRLTLEDLGPGYSMPLCLEHAAKRGVFTVREAFLFAVVMAAVCSLLRYYIAADGGGRAKVEDEPGSLKKRLDYIFTSNRQTSEGEEGPPTASVWKLEAALLAAVAGQDAEVRRQLDVEDEYLAHLLGRYRPNGDKITAEEFHAWVLKAKSRAAILEKETQDSEQEIAQDETKQAEEIFDMVDRDKSNCVDRDELRKVYQAIAKALGKKDAKKTGRQWSQKAFKKATDSFNKGEFIELMRRGVHLKQLLNPRVFDAVKAELDELHAQP